MIKKVPQEFRDKPLRLRPRKKDHATKYFKSTRIDLTLSQFQEQLSLMHGVLEELCERQEGLANWQAENFKRQSLSTDDLALALKRISNVQIKNGFLQRSETENLSQFDSKDDYDDALDHFESLMNDLKGRRIKRLEKTIETIRSHREAWGHAAMDSGATSSVARSTIGSGTVTTGPETGCESQVGVNANSRESHARSSAESLLVVPSRSNIH